MNQSSALASLKESHQASLYIDRSNNQSQESKKSKKTRFYSAKNPVNSQVKNTSFVFKEHVSNEALIKQQNVISKQYRLVTSQKLDNKNRLKLRENQVSSNCRFRLKLRTSSAIQRQLARPTQSGSYKIRTLITHDNIS